MKIPKFFLVVLVLIQLLLWLGHWALLRGVIHFFPRFAHHATGLGVAFFFLGASFLLFSILTWKSRNALLRIGYIFSGIWLPTWLYLMFALLGALITAAFWPDQSRTFTVFWFLAALLLSAYGIVNARILRVTTVSIKLPNLPEYWKGKTAVLVTDVHLGHLLRDGFVNKVVAAINKLKPDIVFMPGDFFDGVKADFLHLASLFGQVRSGLGTYFVSGNHEAFAGYEVAEDAIRAAGMHILENEKAEVRGLQIAGVAYAEESPESLEGILHGLQLDRTRPSILLKHVPNHVAEVARAGVSLLLSGHTHQGQVWPFRYITRKMFKGFDYGLKRFGNLQVYTSSGAGTWGPPMKVFTKSEIVRIVFE